MATKEFLRKLRQKYHLGEYKTGASKPRKPARVRRRAVRRARVVRHSRRVFHMARRRRVSHRRSFGGLGGAGSMAKSALVGIGGAHLAGYIPFNMPFKEEAAGAAASYLTGGKNIKSMAIAAGAVYLTKMMQGGSVASGTGVY